MFAPYCPTCETRVQLGVSRIVAGVGEDGRVDDPILACRCGTHVAWDAAPPIPASAEAGVGEPVGSDGELTPA
jgi:hypothetical protein